eukprot:1761890-Amphidinium_carterae.2
MSTPTTLATPDPRSEVESLSEQHDQHMRTTIEQWTNRTSQLNEMMTYVEQQEQAYMTLEVRMSNERDTWMGEALTLKEQTTSPPQTSQPMTAPPSRIVPPPPRPQQVSGEHLPPLLTPALQHMLSQTQGVLNPWTSQSQGGFHAPIPE